MGDLTITLNNIVVVLNMYLFVRTLQVYVPLLILFFSVANSGPSVYKALRKDNWTPQYGTVNNPKTPALSPVAVSGDIYLVEGDLYKTFKAGIIGVDFPYPDSQNLEGEDWVTVKLGSALYPKPLDGPWHISTGDVVYDSYIDETKIAQKSSGKDGECEFIAFDEKINWMTNLREVIGDRRLGDIFLPGTHDSGTWGCDENSVLVDRTDLFELAQAFDPQILVNWSKTQDDDFTAQLSAGFRTFDLRIADLEMEDGSFRWWHGITADSIEAGLEQFTQFAIAHPQEVIILSFDHFARPPEDGNYNRDPIPNYRKDILADIMIEKLVDRLVPPDSLSNNPTINQILAIGKNIIAEVKDSYIQRKHSSFWPPFIHSGWSGRTNSEDLFAERSGKLRDWLASYPDRVTDLSGCTTPNEKMIVPGLIRVYGEDPTIRAIVELLFPEFLDTEPDLMSFEGIFVDLLTKAREGTNTNGMRVRPSTSYTNGGSVHYSGVNDMVLHWLARPALYKLNTLYVDDFVSSTTVETAIRANRGEFRREVSVAFQGNAKDGYYIWDEDDIQTKGGTDGLNCTAVWARYQVSSLSHPLYEPWNDLPSKAVVSFREGQHPPDTTVSLWVSSDKDNWFELYTNTIQTMIDLNLDVYLRGSNLEDGHGFGYISYMYDLFGAECTSLPNDGYINKIEW